MVRDNAPGRFTIDQARFADDPVFWREFEEMVDRLYKSADPKDRAKARLMGRVYPIVHTYIKGEMSDPQITYQMLHECLCEFMARIQFTMLTALNNPAVRQMAYIGFNRQVPDMVNQFLEHYGFTAIRYEPSKGAN